MRSDLEDNSDNVDTATGDDGRATSNDFGNITSDERTEESTSRENRDDQRVVRSSERSSGRTLNDVDEDSGASDTVDVS